MVAQNRHNQPFSQFESFEVLYQRATDYNEQSADNYEVVVQDTVHEELRYDGSARNLASHAVAPHSSFRQECTQVLGTWSLNALVIISSLLTFTRTEYLLLCQRTSAGLLQTFRENSI